MKEHENYHVDDACCELTAHEFSMVMPGSQTTLTLVSTQVVSLIASGEHLTSHVTLLSESCHLY